MKLHELRAPEGSTKKPKRRGRGTATGQGKTGGRGMNGQNSRSGGGTRLGFEGGQMPLYRRIPKRGFTNIWRKEYTILNVDDLGVFKTKEQLLNKYDYIFSNNFSETISKSIIAPRPKSKGKEFNYSSDEYIQLIDSQDELNLDSKHQSLILKRINGKFKIFGIN